MKEKLSLLTELIKLANCDKTLKEQEYNFISAVAKSLEVDHQEFEKLFNQYIDFTPPVSEVDRILQFHRLVLLMNIDKATKEEELKIVRNLGFRMGLNPLSTETVLHEMNMYPDKIIPTQRLLEIFKANFN